MLYKGEVGKLIRLFLSNLGNDKAEKSCTIHTILYSSKQPRYVEYIPRITQQLP